MRHSLYVNYSRRKKRRAQLTPPKERRDALETMLVSGVEKKNGWSDATTWCVFQLVTALFPKRSNRDLTLTIL